MNRVGKGVRAEVTPRHRSPRNPEPTIHGGVVKWLIESGCEGIGIQVILVCSDLVHGGAEMSMADGETRIRDTK